MITEDLIQKCLDYFAVHYPSCVYYINASQLWESSGHDVAAMLEHEDADKWRYFAACDVRLSQAKRWKLVRDIRDEEWRYRAAYFVRLSRSRRWKLVRDIRDEEWRYRAACYVPDLSRSQRWELVRDIQDEHKRYYAACLVPDLTAKRRAELRRGKCSG